MLHIILIINFINSLPDIPIKLIAAVLIVFAITVISNYRINIPGIFIFEPAQTQHIVSSKSDKVLNARQKKPTIEIKALDKRHATLYTLIQKVHGEDSRKSIHNLTPPTRQSDVGVRNGVFLPESLL